MRTNSKQYNQTFGHFEFPADNLKMTATEKYLTHKAKMSFRIDNSEIQNDLNHLKVGEAVLLEERDSDETSADEEQESKFEFEVHSGVIDPSVRGQVNEPFTFKTNQMLNQET